MGVDTAGLTADLTVVFEDVGPTKTAAAAAEDVAQAVHDNVSASPDHTDTVAPTMSDDETLGYIVGSRWVIIGSDEYVCLDATATMAVWRNTTTAGASLSSNVPAALGSASAGTGTAASRDDHVHAMPSASDVGAVPTGRTLTGTAPVKIAGGSSADLSADRTISVDVMVGDAGAGGSAGLVPAPAAGDATKFLRGDGTFATPTSGSGDVTGGASATVGAPAVYTNADGKHIGELIGEGILGLIAGVLTKITTTLGDLVYGGASGTPTRLAGNTTTTLKVLAQTGDGAASAAPAWTAVSGLTVGDATNAGVLKLGAADGAQAYNALLTTLAGLTVAAGRVIQAQGGTVAWRIPAALQSRYGSGEDGALVFDGSASVTIDGVSHAPSSGVYTLTRDVHATTLTMSGTAAINTLGFRIRAWKLVMAAGNVIHDDGRAAVGATGGIAVTSAGTLQRGLPAGANGRVNSAGVGASAPAASALVGGQGGSGGAATNAGGAGGSPTRPTAQQGRYLSGWYLDLGFLQDPTNLLQAARGGTGGGAGGSASSSLTSSGGGGGGGGRVHVYALEVDCAGTIRAAGGAGGNASSTSGAAAGGGGGGGGGEVLLVTEHITTAPTLSAPGGAKGTGVNGGGDGADGATGITTTISPQA